MTEFLDRWLKRPDDEVGRNWIAKALICAFPDPWSWNEFTHARAAIAPGYDELVARANRCDGQTLDPHGWKRDQPLLALAATVANKGFVRTAGSEGRKLLFRLLVELIAYDGAYAGKRAVNEFAHALRIELEELSRNPNSRPPNPDFPTVWEAIRWFGSQTNRYPDSATTSWRNGTAGMLGVALLNPAAPLGISATEDEDIGGGILLMAPPQMDSELDGHDQGFGIPPSYWLEPEDDSDLRSEWTVEAKEEIFGASLSTYIPSGRFTEASPTYLTDEQAKHEASRLMAEAENASEIGNMEALRQLLARALSLATATPIRHLAKLRWGQPGPTSPRHYPGYLSPCGRWLYRPELAPKHSKVIRDSWIHLPVPAVLGRALQALGTARVDGGLVFPAGKSKLEGADRISKFERATPTMLHRALISRLVSNRRWGPSAAQYVAGDDLGIDVAPLHYDRILSADLAIWTAEITFKWFGEKPRALGGRLPTHFIGSRLTPDKAAIRSYLGALRGLWSSSSTTLAQRISHRTANLIHGLLLMTGHRPNENLSQITRWDIGQEDRISIIFDKPVLPDWQDRPVALDSQWVDEYRALLSDLTRAVREYEGTALGDASRRALEGSGPIFLAFETPDEIHAFGLQDYRKALPPELGAADNFARHYLNNFLSTCLPEPLRASQLGWSGTRAGAFAEGSPWCVESACAQISSKLRELLKDLGWRPLGVKENEEPMPLPPISWRAVEKAHHARFKDSLTRQRNAAAGRRKDAIAAMAPKLEALLESGERGISLGLYYMDGCLQVAPAQEEPIEVPRNWANDVIFRLAAGDMRSLEAHAARGWLHDLVSDGRRRGILTGPIPRRSHERWPTQAGSFLRQSAGAMGAARRLDELVCESGASRPLKVLVKVALHGGYADLSAVASALQRSSKLSRLRTQQNLLLVEPAQDALDLEGRGRTAAVSAWRHGTMAFHGLAAVAISAWHRGHGQRLDLAAVDAELGQLAGDHLSCADSAGVSLPWLNELVALARVINSLRMDGVARLVGTGQVFPTSAPIDRVVALWDDLPMRPPGAAPEAQPQPLEIQTRIGRRHRTHSLLDQLNLALGAAVTHAGSDRRREFTVRADLERKLRQWIGAAGNYRAEELVALYALLLLTRRARRRERLQLSTIQNYVYAVARPLTMALPADPMHADSDDWTQAFMVALAQVEPAQRPDRALALANFHWVLEQAMPVPEVDFGEVFAFSGRSSYQADAGIITRSELGWVFDVLGESVASARSNDATRESIHFAIQRERLVRVQFSAALRPGEAIRLTFANLPRPGRGRLRIQKSKYQGLKNANARRCPRLISDGLGMSESDLREIGTSEKAKYGSRLGKSDPVFHEIDAPERRGDEKRMFNDASRLLKLATGSVDASPYWIRKAAIRSRLERVMVEDASSLWSISHLLAEVGHSGIGITLMSYVHDAITPFIRWFKKCLRDIDVDQVADAVGRTREAVARRRGGHRSARNGIRFDAGVASLLKRSPYMGQQHSRGPVPCPAFLQVGSERTQPVTPCDVDIALSQLAYGLPASAYAASDWPISQRDRLYAALAHMRDNFGFSIHIDSDQDADGTMQLILPRKLKSDGGLREMLRDEASTSILADLFEVYLVGLQFGIMSTGIAATPARWEQWMQAVPILATLNWKSIRKVRALEVRTLCTASSGRLGLWPTLRWVMACAWIHAQIVDVPGESPANGLGS